MNFPTPLIQGTLIKRYKRFLADIALEDGSIITAHCPNSGSMMGLKEPGIPVAISPANNPARKLKYTLEMVKIGPAWVGVNTQWPNHIVCDALTAGIIKLDPSFQSFKKEITFVKGTRFDIGAYDHEGTLKGFVEVKNVTLREKDTVLFPDAVTTRGQKHLEQLMAVAANGLKAYGIYLVQRDDCKHFSLAAHIDPDYSKLFYAAREKNVEFLCYQCHVSPEGIKIIGSLPILEEK